MKKNVASLPADTALVRTLTALCETSTSINQLSAGQDLSTTLVTIAAGAVKVVAVGSPAIAAEADASAVIWLYDAAGQRLDPASRVSAGEPSGAAVNDQPRPNGLGMQAIRQRRRLLSYEPGSPAIHPAKQALGAKTLVCYPLIAARQPMGALYVYRCDNRHFSEIELLSLDNFVQLAAVAIQHGRQVGGLSQQLSRKVREMERMRRASHLISSRSSLNETLQEILNIGLELTAAQYGSFELYDKRAGMLMTKALAGSRRPLATAQVLPLDERSVVGWVAKHRQSLRINDLSQARWRGIYHPLPTDEAMQSELAVPIIGVGGGLEGVLNIESPQPYAFSQDDQQLLEALAAQAVIAIQEIKLLDAIQEIVEVLLTAQSDELLRLIIDRACDLINAVAGSIWLLSDDNRLVLRQSTEGERLGEEIPLHNSFTGQAIKLRKPVVIDDITGHANFINPDVARQKGWVSAIVAPLLPADDMANPVGSFSLYTSGLRDFSEWDKKMITSLANHAALAIRDAERLRQLKEAQERQATAETIAAVGDVAANLLHQLNNKFGAISVRVQGIETKCAPALEAWPYLAKNLREIADSTRQAMDIVRDSMAPLQPAQPRPVEVGGCIDLALQRAAPPPTVAVTRSGLAQLPPVLAGRQQLEMVFYNLFDNAIKAMKGQGALQLSGRQHNGFVAVAVADSGPGIPHREQATIFEFTAAVNRRQKYGRLSFGLWWVKTFVNRFGGRIELDSRPGHGSRFTVWLPAVTGVTDD